MKEYEQGVPSAEIFKKAGLDRTLVGEDHPKACVRRWRLTVKRSGIQSLTEQRGTRSSGRRKRTHAEADRLKWLEAEVAYLKAENAFLAKLRAKRAE